MDCAWNSFFFKTVLQKLGNDLGEVAEPEQNGAQADGAMVALPCSKESIAKDFFEIFLGGFDHGAIEKTLPSSKDKVLDGSAFAGMVL